jgi:hypothetical protein
MLKTINKSLYILNDKNEKIIVNLDNNGMIVGDYKISGKVNGLWGDASKIEGDVSDIEGNLDEAIAEYLQKNDFTELKNTIHVSLLID